MALFAVLPAPPAVAQSAPDTVFRDCPRCPEMVVIPAGSFTMGAADWNTGLLSGDGPPRRVTIGYDFAIGVHEVTFDEWEACEQRVLRGGTWSYTVEMLRVDMGVPLGPDHRDNGLGFRVVRAMRPPG